MVVRDGFIGEKAVALANSKANATTMHLMDIVIVQSEGASVSDQKMKGFSFRFAMTLATDREEMIS